MTYSRKSDRREDFVHPAEPYPRESFYTLKLRNTNLLGPTGMYLLPSMNPWVCTVNSWYIEVEGEMVNFLIFDADNVCHPNPMFGHEWQVYQRREEKIRDMATGEYIGLNTPITFSFGRSGLEAMIFLKKVKHACKGKLPRVFIDGGTWYPWALERVGFKRYTVISFGPRSAIERLFGVIERRIRQFGNGFIGKYTRESMERWTKAFAGFRNWKKNSKGVLS